MAQHFVVEGGRPLQGTVRPAGNKNAALPLIAATLLADGPSELVNVPRIRDVEIQLALLEDLGATVAWTAPGRVRVDPGGLRDAPLDADLCHRLRASVLLAGPLLARFGQVTLPPPGGDVIGRRRLDTHFLAFERLGAVVDVGDAYRVSARALAGADIFLDEPSVTATENALMAAVRAPGRTVLRNAASEPHVQDLARGLTAMGARISGLGTNVLVVEGVDTLRGTTLEIGPDHIEIGSFIGLAAVTDGDVRIEGVRPADLESILLQFDRLGVRPRLDGTTLHVEPSQERRIRPDLGGHVPKIEDGPWPAFPADLTSIMVVLATQCDGLVMIFEKMFESRLYFVDKLVGMGARAVLCDPHRVVIAGPSPLRGGVVESPDIRAGMAMLLAALAAEGRSEIHNIGQIDRGYERIDERLRALGASVERVGDPGPVR
jgi:UDP-N-acetylglucosamine 1-carboxyvinyltransferase